MIPLRELDLLGVFVAPAAPCMLVALAVALVLRRLLDRTRINQLVWNRALFDLSLLVGLASLLVLSLRFGV